MTIKGYTERECIHGFEDRKVRGGLPACPVCRRVVLATGRAPAPTPPPPSRRHLRVVQPMLDVQALRAGETVGDVIDLATRRGGRA